MNSGAEGTAKELRQITNASVRANHTYISKGGKHLEGVLVQQMPPSILMSSTNDEISRLLWLQNSAYDAWTGLHRW